MECVNTMTKKKLKKWLETIEIPVVSDSKLIMQNFCVVGMLVSYAVNVYVKCVRKAGLRVGDVTARWPIRALQAECQLLPEPAEGTALSVPESTKQVFVLVQSRIHQFVR